VLAICLAAVLGCEGRWSDAKVAESKGRGEEIIAALEHFRQDQGKYPAKLEELVPAYLKELRPPTAGNRKWKYVTSLNADGFLLYFQGDSNREPVVNRKNGETFWSADTK
jgi:hypothetical protein